VGDLFLVQVGQRIIRQCDGNDIAGRLGGDEFMLACLGSGRGKSDEAYLCELKARLSGHIIGDYSLGNIRIYYPGASIGIVEIDPTQTDADTALRMADVAMYQEKKGRQKSPFIVLD